MGITADPTSVACGDGFAPTPETASDSNQVGSIALKFTSISDPDCSTGSNAIGPLQKWSYCRAWAPNHPCRGPTRMLASGFAPAPTAPTK